MILLGDCLEHMRAMDANSIDAIVTDPPYGLTQARPGGRSDKTRGAIAEGFQFIGIELDPEYHAIAEARIKAMQPGLSLGVVA